MGIFAFSAFRFRSQFKIARSEAGDTKPGSTGPHTNLDPSRTIGTIFYVCSPAVRLLGGYCKQQISPAGVDDKICSPAPPNVFGIDRVTAGRAVGLLAVLAGVVLTQTALKTLGDQYNSIGVSSPFSVVYKAPTGS